MLFGLTNAPTTFQRIVLNIFRKLIRETIAVFLDDWTLYKIMKNHIENLRTMLQTCRENKLCLNLEKCTFLVPFGNLLGHVVSKDGLMIDSAKIATILHLP